MRKLLSLLTLIALLALAAVPTFAQDNPSIPELLTNDDEGRFTTLLAAVEAAGLGETLSGEGPFTLIAPTNDAFAAALDYLGVSAEDLLGDTELLTQVLSYHVIPGEYFFRELTASPTLDSALEGETVSFTLESGVLTAEGASLRDVDNVASNGIVHVAEAVMLPAALREAAAANRAHIRVAHFSADAGAVDVYLNGTLTDLVGVEFGTVSEWTEVASQPYRVGVAATGDEPTKNVLSRVEPGSWVTIAVIGLATGDSLDVQFLEELYTEIPEGQARLHVFHAIPNAPAIDIVVGGSDLIVNLAYPGSLGDNDGLDVRTVPNLTYDIQVFANGDRTTPLLELPLTLNEGSNYLLAAVGTPTVPSVVVIETAAVEEAAE